MKRFPIFAAVIFALSWSVCGHATQSPAPNRIAVSAENPVGRAFKNRESSVQVEDEGTIVRLLADDLEGGRHQRFIVRLASGQTVLIAHNIDIAPRVAGLQKGEGVRFCGDYMWSEQGGTVHWTHRDPRGRHAAGWLKYNGQIYQ